MSLSASAACKRANRRGYLTKQVKGLITMWDRGRSNPILTNATPDAIDAWLQSANKREARAWKSE